MRRAAPSRKGLSRSWWASFGNIYASGGVYLGVAAEKIVANRARIHRLDRRDPAQETPLEVAGGGSASVLKPFKAASTKDILSPDRALTEARAPAAPGVDRLRGGFYGQFLAAVARAAPQRGGGTRSSPMAGLQRRPGQKSSDLVV